MLNAAGEATLTTYMRVDKANGAVIYYRVDGDTSVEISEAEYKENS